MSDKLVSALSALGGSLPAQFLVLVLLNIVFIGGLLWFLDNHEQRRLEALRPVLTACVDKVRHND